MTAVERLVKLKSERNVTWAEIGRISGAKPATLTMASNGHSELGNLAISKLVKFDESFEQYIEYRECRVCGEEFIPMRESHATCSLECQNINRNIENKQYMREYWERMRMSKPIAVSEFEPLGEYNEKAREKFGSYGQRAAAERLARSGTMRESMGMG